MPRGHASVPREEHPSISAAPISRCRRLDGAWSCRWGPCGTRLIVAPLERRSGKNLLLSDGPLGSAAPDESDEPVERGGHPVFEAGEERQVDKEPQQPAEEAGDPNRADRRHRLEARDRRHVTEVFVFERV